MVTIEPSETRVNREDVARFEKWLGVDLPPDYVAFLAECNGGYAESNILELVDTSIAVRNFYGLNLEAVDDLKANVSVFRGRVPTGSLAIADLEGGDQLVMAWEKRHLGRIYWWEHDVEPDRFSDMTLVAKSFGELMEKLQPDTDEVELDPDGILGVWDGPFDPEDPDSGA